MKIQTDLKQTMEKRASQKRNIIWEYIIMYIAVGLTVGCVSISTNAYPPGKSDADWEDDERECLEQSKLITGAWALSPISAATNVERREKYRSCLIKKGWIVEKGKPGELKEGAVTAKRDKTKEELAKEVYIDTITGLMWASRDNGYDINWRDAKAYCNSYGGGGYTDWRMPTQDELARLYEKSINGNNDYHLTKMITLTACCPWASEMRDSTAASFGFDNGERDWTNRHIGTAHRALSVRNAK